MSTGSRVEKKTLTLRSGVSKLDERILTTALGRDNNRRCYLLRFLRIGASNNGHGLGVVIRGLVKARDIDVWDAYRFGTTRHEGADLFEHALFSLNLLWSGFWLPREDDWVLALDRNSERCSG